MIGKVVPGDEPTTLINDRDDRATMKFDVDSFANSNLGEGTSVIVEITTMFGGQTTVRLTVPESLSRESIVAL